MAQDLVLLPDEFDAQKMTLSAPRALKSGGKTVYVNYKGEKLLFQTPVMVAPFGINKWQNEDGSGPVKYSLDLSFDGMDTRPVLKKFYDNLNEIDSKLIKEGFANHDKWLSLKKAPKSTDDVENVYTRIIKTPKDAKYSPTFKINLPHDGSSFTFNVYDNNKQAINLFDMIAKNEIDTKRCKVSAIIQCTGIWIVGGKSFGCSWKVVQMEIITRPRGITNEYAIRRIKNDDVPADDDEEEKPVAKKSSTRCDPEDESEDVIVESEEEEVAVEDE